MLYSEETFLVAPKTPFIVTYDFNYEMIRLRLSKAAIPLL